MMPGKKKFAKNVIVVVMGKQVRKAGHCHYRVHLARIRKSKTRGLGQQDQIQI